MPLFQETTSTLGLLFILPSILCLIAALTVLNCFCCQLSKVAFPMSLYPPGALDIQRQRQTGHTETRLLFWALGH